MRKTGVIEILEDLQDVCPDYYNSNYNWLHKILEKEKKQIIDAWENGYSHRACVNEDKYRANQYYEEIQKE